MTDFTIWEYEGTSGMSIMHVCEGNEYTCEKDQAVMQTEGEYFPQISVGATHKGKQID